MPKSAMRLMNSSKNKLNSEIILIFNPNPNGHLLSMSMILVIFFYYQSIRFHKLFFIFYFLS